jgi:hypothetical protein
MQEAPSSSPCSSDIFGSRLNLLTTPTSVHQRCISDEMTWQFPRLTSDGSLWCGRDFLPTLTLTHEEFILHHLQRQSRSNIGSVEDVKRRVPASSFRAPQIVWTAPLYAVMLHPPSPFAIYLNPDITKACDPGCAFRF